MSCAILTAASQTNVRLLPSVLCVQNRASCIDGKEQHRFHRMHAGGEPDAFPIQVVPQPTPQTPVVRAVVPPPVAPDFDFTFVAPSVGAFDPAAGPRSTTGTPLAYIYTSTNCCTVYTWFEYSRRVFVDWPDSYVKYNHLWYSNCAILCIATGSLVLPSTRHLTATSHEFDTYHSSLVKIQVCYRATRGDVPQQRQVAHQ